MQNVKKITATAKNFDLYKTITAIVKGELGRDRSRVLVNDDMKGKGIKLEWFKSPRNKEAPEAHLVHYSATKAAVIAAFDSPERNLYFALSSELEAGNAPGQRGDSKNAAPGTRRYIHQQVTAAIGKFGASYKTYLNPKVRKKGPDSRKPAPTDAAPTDAAPTDIKTHAAETLIELVKRLQKAGNVAFDMVLVISLCEKALKAIATK